MVFFVLESLKIAMTSYPNFASYPYDTEFVIVILLLNPQMGFQVDGSPPSIPPIPPVETIN